LEPSSSNMQNAAQTRASTMEFFDPHFHIWDLKTPAPEGSGYPLLSGHDDTILFAPQDDPIYTTARYEEEFGAAKGITHIGGAFLEAVSVCHVDMAGTDPNYTAACLAEARWVADELGKSSKTYVLCPTAPLESPDAKATLQKLAAIPNVRGIRQVLNCEPDWPRNGKLGNLMENEAWLAGYAELAAVNFSFDAQLNPPQYAQAAGVFGKHPDTTVIINHLGCPTLKDLTENADVFWHGMEALAKHPKTYIKISMLCYITPDWDESDVVVKAVHKLIAIFGPDRCFFASNYPVDVKDNWGAERLFAAFFKLASRYSEGVQKKLFSLNAKAAYRV